MRAVWTGPDGLTGEQVFPTLEEAYLAGHALLDPARAFEDWQGELAEARAAAGDLAPPPSNPAQRTPGALYLDRLGRVVTPAGPHWRLVG